MVASSQVFKPCSWRFIGSKDAWDKAGALISHALLDTEEFSAWVRMVRLPMVCRRRFLASLIMTFGSVLSSAVQLSVSVSPVEPSFSGQFSTQFCGKICSTVRGESMLMCSLLLPRYVSLNLRSTWTILACWRFSYTGCDFQPARKASSVGHSTVSPD